MAAAPLGDLAQGAVVAAGGPMGYAGTNGLLIYKVKRGDTLSEIAAGFNISTQTILNTNPEVRARALRLGQEIYIAAGAAGRPQAAPTQVSVVSAGNALPLLRGYFALPTDGFNWGKLHDDNAVDIANACGTPVTAAAKGVVLAAAAGWNGGYGTNATLEHPNGTQTRYAHLAELVVEQGDYLEQGQKLGLMGDTGETTGCHLHFEVQGAQNPFVK